MNSQLALTLPASASSNTVFINVRCTLRVEEDQRVIIVAGLPVHHYRGDDAVAEAYAMVLLVESGFAQQTEVARAFGISERTVRRHQQRYAQQGMVGLGRTEGWRRGRRRVTGQRLRSIERLKSEGLSNRAIAQRLGVNEKAIRKLVGPPKAAEVEQLMLATIPSLQTSQPPPGQASCAAIIEESADSAQRLSREDCAGLDERAENNEPVPMSLDHDASDRSLDRQLAHLGLLDDAAPIFRDGEQIAGVGVLLALPYLAHSGLLQIARKLYGEIGPAFYGLRTTLLTLWLMALLRIRRPEHLKERDPAGLGRLLGLDRAPEVKTLRRQLTRLAAQHHAEQLGAELARLRVDQRGALMGFLYVDGHVRAYHGERMISRAYVARRHLAMPATTDYWVNDRAGDPLLLITGDINAA
jgi:DNA-binding CsgD family transcriptional regulator